MRVWIKNYSAIARPLVDLTRKGVEFVWAAKTMQALKNVIANSLILADGPETRGLTLAVLAALLGQHPADCATVSRW